eukprot:gene487-519_t
MGMEILGYILGYLWDCGLGGKLRGFSSSDKKYFQGLGSFFLESSCLHVEEILGNDLVAWMIFTSWAVAMFLEILRWTVANCLASRRDSA